MSCNRLDDVSTIKRNRKLVKKFHPDFTQRKDMHDGFVKMATEKLCEINEIYEMIKKERNF